MGSRNDYIVVSIMLILIYIVYGRKLKGTNQPKLKFGQGV